MTRAIVQKAAILIKPGITIPIPKDISSGISSIRIFQDTIVRSRSAFNKSATYGECLKAISSIRICKAEDVLQHEETSALKVKERQDYLNFSKSWPIPAIDGTIKLHTVKVLNLNGNNKEDDGTEKPGTGKVLNLNGNNKEVAALLENFRLLPVIMHDYDKVPLGTWYPQIEGLSKYSLQKLGGKKCEFGQGMLALGNREAYFMAVAGESSICYLFSCGKTGIEGVIAGQSELLQRFSEDRISYAADCDYPLSSGATTLFRAAYGKEEVWEMALAGKMFPPKSTRHELGFRVKPKIPIDWFRQPYEAIAGKFENAIKGIVQYLEALPP